MKGFQVFGILWDGKSFEFFSFDSSASLPSFTRGCLPGDPPEFCRGLQLSDFTLTGPARFIAELRYVNIRLTYELFCLELDGISTTIRTEGDERPET